MTFSAVDFIRESNKIEGIFCDPLEKEIAEYARFMAQEEITVADMQEFVDVYQPGAVLRRIQGLNVRVGNYFPPKGGIDIEARLIDILKDASWDAMIPIEFAMHAKAYEIHHRYESLHPFTDGNGRSGRMLWMWMMRRAPLGFLHTWYYQSLSAGRVK